MCVIIDANVLGHVFCKAPQPAAKVLLTWITDAGGIVVYGGSKYRTELFGNEQDDHSKPEGSGQSGRSLSTKQLASRQFAQWYRAGRAFRVSNSQVDTLAITLRKEGRLKSDDEHIIALAQVSGARVLYSNDKNLHCDFKNKDLVDDPGGKIYQTKDQTHLLKHCASCDRQRKNKGLPFPI